MENSRKVVYLGYLMIGLILHSCQPKPAAPERKWDVTQASTEDLTPYIGQGRIISSSIFMKLSLTLQEQMQAGGPLQAIPYCQLKAMPITDSLQQHFKAEVKRTSLQWRNPSNEPNKKEAKILEDWAHTVRIESLPTPFAEKNEDNTVSVYSPIFVQEGCLPCHGKLKTDISEATYALLKEKYPTDQAVGYEAGALRGMWSIKLPMK